MSDMSRAMVRGLIAFLTEHEAEAVKAFHLNYSDFCELQQAIYNVSRKHTAALNGQPEVAALNPNDPPPADNGEA